MHWLNESVNYFDGKTQFTLADVLSSVESLPSGEPYFYSGPQEKATDLLDV